MVNFTGNDTALQLANYIGEGFLNIFGTPELIGWVTLIFVMAFCYFTHLPLDGSAFLVLFAVMVLGWGGFLPMSVFFIALILTALLLAWFVFKVFALK